MKKIKIKYCLIIGVSLFLAVAVSLIVYFNRSVVVPQISGKNIKIATEMLDKAGIKTNVKNDNSDSKISDVVIQGLVMGIIDISKRIDDFEKEANKDIVKLANRLLEFQESSVEKLKEYL